MRNDAATRRSPRARLVRVALLALAAIAAPAAGQTVTAMSLSPAAPTWRDRIELTIVGTIPGNCIPIIPAPNPTALEAHRIDLTFALACPPSHSPDPIPLATNLTLEPIEPGSYALRVLDLSGTVLAQQSVIVYEVGDAAIELPPVSTADHPGALRLTWLAGAGSPAASVEVDGRIIWVHVSSPPPYPVTQLATLDVPLPPLAAGRNEIRVLLPGFPGEEGRLVRSELHVLRPAGCVPGDETLCLHDGRFRVTATWRDFAGRTGVAHAAPLAGNDGSGLLWFFGPDNTELTVKVLDACTISQRWWTFVSSSSTVEYTLTVTDTATGATRTYSNPLGQVPRLVADTAAFGCP